MGLLIVCSLVSIQWNTGAVTAMDSVVTAVTACQNFDQLFLIV